MISIRYSSFPGGGFPDMLPIPHEISCRWFRILQIRYWILQIFPPSGKSSREDDPLRRFSQYCKGGGQNVGMLSSMTDMPLGDQRRSYKGGESTRYRTHCEKNFHPSWRERTLCWRQNNSIELHSHCQSANRQDQDRSQTKTASPCSKNVG